MHIVRCGIGASEELPSRDFLSAVAPYSGSHLEWILKSHVALAEVLDREEVPEDRYNQFHLPLSLFSKYSTKCIWNHTDVMYASNI